MTLRAGDITIVGTKDNVVRVTCQLDHAEDGPKIQIRFAASRLTVSGGPNKGIHYRIEVPQNSGLQIKASAGNMDIKGITGDKDVELNAGNLTMEVGDPASYKVAEGKVMAGDLNARPFGAQTGGLGRSFRKESSTGRYRLRAELMAGDLTLK